MAKYYGRIGFAETIETSPGIWEEAIIDHYYTGDLNRNNRRRDSGEHLNDNITVNNEISIVADPYAYQNFHLIRYAEWMGTLWKITSVDVQSPRLILSFGGVYNGPEPEQREETGVTSGTSRSIGN